MRPLVHIGYHKTASTWLQRQIFQPRMGFRPLLEQAQVDQMLITPHDLDFDYARTAATLATKLKSVENSLTPVLSSENLTGHPFFGGRDSAALAKRLRSVVPNATILMVVRSQATILPSVYMQYLKRGGVQKPASFFSGSSGVNYPGFELQHFEFDRLFALYQSLFSSVLVLTYEMLLRDPRGFAKELLSQAGCDPCPLDDQQLRRVSPSPSTRAAPLLRTANHFRRSVLNPAPLIPLTREGSAWDKIAFAAARQMPKGSGLTDYVARELAPLYGRSNANLARLTRGTVDLSAYPYTASSPTFQESTLTTAAGPVMDL